MESTLGFTTFTTQTYILRKIGRSVGLPLSQLRGLRRDGDTEAALDRQGRRTGDREAEASCDTLVKAACC
jgi:hypothetical protein